MKILIIDNETKYLEKILTLIEKNHEVRILKLNQLSCDLEVNNFDLIILSGGKPSRLNLTSSLKQAFINIEEDIIKNTNVPIIGICYGFKLINHAFGSALEYKKANIKGGLDVQLTSDFWKNFKNRQQNKNITCYENHHYVCKQISVELLQLASSNRGIEIVKHKHKNIFGLQFHPEVNTEKLDGDEIFNYILDFIFSKLA